MSKKKFLSPEDNWLVDLTIKGFDFECARHLIKSFLEFKQNQVVDDDDPYLNLDIPSVQDLVLRGIRILEKCILEDTSPITIGFLTGEKTNYPDGEKYALSLKIDLMGKETDWEDMENEMVKAGARKSSDFFEKTDSEGGKIQ